ncbi:hypothetical protein ACXZ1K_13545 [Pedobacter sp. PWIIR3]
MKHLMLALLVLTGFTVKGQITTTTVTNADGTKSPSFSMALGKPKTTINSQSSYTYPNGMQPEPFIAKPGANKKTYILLANESDASVAKFEIDIYSGNKTLSKGTLAVRISATSFTPKLLGNGEYKFSDKSPAERLKYEFSGTVMLGEKEVPISGGWFLVERTGKTIKLKYDLILGNGVKTVGEYNMEYQTEDRSSLAQVK